MPNRIIKESINESCGLSECTIFAIDLFKRLITYADDYGRFNSDTTIMRARLYPREYEYVTEEDLIDGLSELAGVGKISFYTATHFNQGKNPSGVYGVFPNWKEHQRVRDSKARCPEPSDTDINDWYLRRFVPLDLKAEILERDGFKCKICGKFLTSSREPKRFAKLGSGLYHIDHIVPLVQGGRATLENLRLTCPECNLKRKKRFTFRELLEESMNPPQLAANCSESRPESNPNPIQSESESKEDAFASFAGENEALLSALNDFRKMRKSQKSPMTDRAEALLLSELEKLSKNPEVQIAILNQSIMNGWKSVYALKENGRKGGNGGERNGIGTQHAPGSDEAPQYGYVL